MEKKIIVYKDGSHKPVDVSWEYENDPDWLTTIDLSIHQNFEPLREVLNILQERIDSPNARLYVTEDLKSCWNKVSDYITIYENVPTEDKKAPVLDASEMEDKIRHIIDILKQNPHEYISKEHTIRLIEVWATEDKKAPVQEDETAESVLLRRGVHYTIPNEIKTVTVKSAVQAMKEFGSQERNRLCDKMKEILYDDSFSSQEKIGELKKIV